MKRILVTGGSGFVGSHLCGHLRTRGYDVHATFRRQAPEPRDSHVTWHHWHGDEDEFARIARTARPDIVIHAAARAMPSRDLREFPSQYRETVQPCLAVALGASTDVELLMFLGSCEEYGAGPAPAVETQALHAMSPYGWAKISAYHGARAVCESKGVSWCWLRPYLVFGPGQLGDRLIPTTIQRCLHAQEVPLTAGEQTRDFVYVPDLCSMIGRVIEQPRRAVGQVLNLCSGQPRTIHDVASTIQRIVGHGTVRLGMLPYRANEAMQFYGSPARYEALFGHPATTPFEMALRETVAWHAMHGPPAPKG